LLSAEPSWLAAADRLSREQPVPLRACGITDLDYARTCGYGRRGALLVRPDGFVAWRTATAGRTEADGYARLSSVLADVVEAKAS
jgi:putative polyketide hydroxylase